MSMAVLKAIRPTAKGQRTRASLLEAAERLFGVDGYDGTSIVDLTREADIALGTFYIYFPDKKTIFVELVDTLGSRLRHHLSERIRGVDERLAVERRGFEAFLEFVAEHRQLYRIVRQADFVDQKCFRRYYQRMAAGYAEGLATASKRGEIRKGDPEVMAYCLMGIADFVGMRWGLWEKRPSRAVIDEAFRFIEGGLAAAAAPKKRVTSRRG